MNMLERRLENLAERPVKYTGVDAQLRLEQFQQGLAASELVEGKLPAHFNKVMTLYSNGQISELEAIDLCKEIAKPPTFTQAPTV